MFSAIVRPCRIHSNCEVHRQYFPYAKLQIPGFLLLLMFTIGITNKYNLFEHAIIGKSYFYGIFSPFFGLYGTLIAISIIGTAFPVYWYIKNSLHISKDRIIQFIEFRNSALEIPYHKIVKMEVVHLSDETYFGFIVLTIERAYLETANMNEPILRFYYNNINSTIQFGPVQNPYAVLTKIEAMKTESETDNMAMF